MSQRAISLAVRDRLWELFDWDDMICDCTPGGRPKPACGELFVGVDGGGISNSATESRMDYHSVLIFVTRRAPIAPFDSQAEELIQKAKTGLDMISEAIAARFHTDPDGYDVLNAANDYILSELDPDVTVYGFSVPLRFQGLSSTIDKTGEWFSADPQAPQQGYVKIITLGGALRLQSIALQA